MVVVQRRRRKRQSWFWTYVIRKRVFWFALAWIGIPVAFVYMQKRLMELINRTDVQIWLGNSTENSLNSTAEIEFYNANSWQSRLLVRIQALRDVYTCITTPTDARVYELPYHPAVHSPYVEDLLTVPESDTTMQTEAICRFNRTCAGMRYDHFPHAMEQLIRCAGYWRLHPHATPVLDLQGQYMSESAFWNGLIERLQQERGLQLVDSHPSTTAAVPLVYCTIPNTEYQYRVTNKKDIEYWTSLWIPPSSECPIRSTFRITILNRTRKSLRHILGASQLQEWLETHLNGTTVTVITSLDDYSLQDQVHVFSKTDLMISPHGAQLVGIPFLPPCAHVLEVFPAHYFMPKFFGSLSLATNIRHWYLYLGYDAPSVVDTAWMYSRWNRATYRGQQLCLRRALVMDQMVPAIEKIMKKHLQCCQQSRQED